MIAANVSESLRLISPEVLKFDRKLRTLFLSLSLVVLTSLFNTAHDEEMKVANRAQFLRRHLKKCSLNIIRTPRQLFALYDVRKRVCT